MDETLKVRRGDLTLPVRSAGPDDGEPVIFLHGFPQTSAAWSPYLARFSALGFRALAPDQRGYAMTARPTCVRQYAIDDLVADVLGIADVLGVERFHLVGHDWGGVIGWALAAACPDRLWSMTSVSTPHPRALASSLWRSSQLARSWYVAFFQVPHLPERLLTAANGALLRRALRDSGLPDTNANAYLDTLLEPGAMRAAINYYRALSPRRTLAVGRITVPTLYVWSTNDLALGPVAARATGGEIDGPYRFEVLDGVGHWIPETCVDELSGLVLDHLRMHPRIPSPITAESESRDRGASVAAGELEPKDAGHEDKQKSDPNRADGLAVQRPPDDRGPGRTDADPDAVGGADRDGVSRLREGDHAEGEQDHECAGRQWTAEALGRRED